MADYKELLRKAVEALPEHTAPIFLPHCADPNGIDDRRVVTGDPWAAAHLVVWDPDQEYGGLTVDQIKKAKILLWKGHCSVHQMFQPAHIIKFRNQYPDGFVISHPESALEVCRQSDYVGSTEYIIKVVKESAPGTRWLVGTELNLVNRLAEEVKHEGKIVQFMAPTVCMCSTMQRIDPQHLAWTLENLADGKVVNRITVPEHEATLARIALQRMLAVS